MSVFFWFLLLSGLDTEHWFTGSEAYRELRLSGREVAAEKMVDIDGDGLADALIAERTQEGIGMSVWKGGEKNRYSLLGRLPASAGELLVRFDLVQLDEKTPALWLEVAEESPDEDDHHFRLVRFDPAPRVVLETRFRIQHPEQQAGRRERRIVWLGPDFQGVRLKKLSTGWPQFELLTRPRMVALRGKEEPVWLALGIDEMVFSPAGGQYHLEREGYLNFLPAVEGVEREEQRVDGRELAITLRLNRPAALRMIRLFFPCPRERAAEIEEMTIQADQDAPLPVKPGAAPADVRLAGIGEFFQSSVPGWQQLVLLEKPTPPLKRLLVKILLGKTPSHDAPVESCLPEVGLHLGLYDS